MSVPVAAIGVLSRLWFVSLLLGSSVVGFWRGLVSCFFVNASVRPFERISIRAPLPGAGTAIEGRVPRLTIAPELVS